MTKYKNKYRIPSTRLETWNYNNTAAYFITVITKNREYFFGEIVETPQMATSKIMQLSEIGKIVQTEWIKTPSLRPDMNLTLDEFVVMPDHFHGIIIIGKNEYNGGTVGVKGKDDVIGVGDARHCVSTMKTHDVHVQCTALPDKNLFAFQSKNLASIMRGFKSAVTMQARKYNSDFTWQPRFYDHVIRNNQDIDRIRDYIENNRLCAAFC